MIEWRSIPGMAHYEVSNVGQVRSLDRVILMKNGVARKFKGREIAQVIAKTGHRTVHLYEDTELMVKSVHRLVLEAFDRSPKGNEVCRHLNGDPNDNRIENLAWGTYSDNAFDRVEHGNHEKRNRTHCPRGHALMEPNLVRYEMKRGHRKCKACHRARSWCERRGLVDSENMQRVSDEKYGEIIGKDFD